MRCARHPEREAPTSCRRCRAPVCPECAVLSPAGSFCSAECRVVHGALSRPEAGEDPLLRRMGWAVKAVSIAFGVLVLLIALHGAARAGFKPAKPIDVLGRLFESLDVLKRRGEAR